MASDEWAEWRARARLEPAWWAYHTCGRMLWQRQLDVLEALRDNPRVTVRSGHGIGKTAVAAVAVAWFVTVQEEDTIVLTTAPTARQVEQLLWGEIHRLVEQSEVLSGMGQLNRSEWRFGPRRFALGMTTTCDTDRFQGFHAPNVLVVVDEASGVPEPIYEALEGVLTSGNCRLLLIGNPLRAQGHFYESHRPGSGYERITISCLESPNVVAGEELVPGMVTREWVERQKQRWGEDSPWYRSHVLGEFPEGATNALLTVAAVEAARSVEPRAEGAAELGCDVARYGDDQTVIVVRRGNAVVQVETRQGSDTVQVAGLVRQVAERWGVAPGGIRIDDTGVGGGVTDTLRAGGLNVRAVNASGSAEGEGFADVRTESWWRACEAVGKGCLSLQGVPERMVTDLLAPTYRFLPSGAIRLEPKADVKKRLGRSPDYGDALALTYAHGSLLPDFWVV